MSKGCVVLKFGGSSVLNNPENIEKIVNQAEKDYDEVYVVASALKGVTNKLIDILDVQNRHGCFKEELEGIVDLHYDFMDNMGLTDEKDELEPVLSELEKSFTKKYRNKNQKRAEILSFGEKLSSKIYFLYLNLYHKAAWALPENIGMKTNSNFLNAELLKKSYPVMRKKLKSIARKNNILVIPGFYAVDKKGRITNQGRGSSDKQGAQIAKAVNAKKYYIYTDKNGMFKVNPDLIPEAEIINKTTYIEARALGSGGARVLHEATLVPLQKTGIELIVKNTSNPKAKGTTIVEDMKSNCQFTGIAYREGVYLIRVYEMGMDEKSGYVEKITRLLADLGLAFKEFHTDIDTVDFTFPPPMSDTDKRKYKDSIYSAFKKLPKLKGINPSVNLYSDYTTIRVVGREFNKPGTSEKLAGALRKANVNIEYGGGIIKGPISIPFGVKGIHTKKAVQALYKACFPK